MFIAEAESFSVINLLRDSSALSDTDNINSRSSQTLMILTIVTHDAKIFHITSIPGSR